MRFGVHCLYRVGGSVTRRGKGGVFSPLNWLFGVVISALSGSAIFAVSNTGPMRRSKGGEYFDDLGFYQSRLEHNQFSRYEDGPNAKVYPLDRDSFWEWAGDTSRERYRSLRNSSITARRQAVFMTGLLVVNHLVSAVHAARTAGGAGDIRTTLVPIFTPGRFRASLSMVLRF